MAQLKNNYKSTKRTRINTLLGKPSNSESGDFVAYSTDVDWEDIISSIPEFSSGITSLAIIQYLENLNRRISLLEGGEVEPPTPSNGYYWYVGQTDPSTMTSISPIVTDTSSPGWRLIGPTLPTYSSSNMLWNGDTNNITFENRDYYYIAVPNESIKIYNGANVSVMDSFTNISTTNIGGITYYIYPCNSKARAFGYLIY